MPLFLAPLAIAAGVGAAAAGLKWLLEDQSEVTPIERPSPPAGSDLDSQPVLRAIERLRTAVAAGNPSGILAERERLTEAYVAWVAAHPAARSRDRVEALVRAQGNLARTRLRGRAPGCGGLRGDVLMIGRTGVGKSTLVNGVLGIEVASTGIGRPVTQDVRRYQSDDGCAALVDTPGFELGGRGVRHLTVLASLADVVWFCLAAEEGRIDPSELDALADIRPHAPTLVVATSVLDRNSDLGWLRTMLPEAVMVTLARERSVGATTIEPHGLTEVVEATRRLMAA